nr:phosphatidylethanolamine N-methyltransferase isoform X1 [Paramormyrops kingsleyae]
MNGASASLKKHQLDCCGGLNNVDYTQIDISAMVHVLQFVDLSDSRFWGAVLIIIFNPLFWNVVGRWEHWTRGLSRLFGGPYVALYFLASLIVLLNVFRSHSITEAMKAQPKWELLDSTLVFYTGLVLMVLGSIFVLSSFYALGFTGTFLGDYFGILMEHRITGFPFNVMDNPMYWGSTGNYLGLALIHASPVGLILTVVVGVCYKVALFFEGPFTEAVYREKACHSKSQ